jgi:curved DNA-binding protein CbpA
MPRENCAFDIAAPRRRPRPDLPSCLYNAGSPGRIEEPAVQDLYDILDVPGNASDAWIKRAYEIKKKAALADETLPAPQREALLKDIEKAYGVLSNPAKREVYDNPDQMRRGKRSLASAATVEASTSSSTWLIVLAAGLLVVGGLGYQLYAAHELKQQQRLDAERVAAENVRQAQLAAEREERAREAELARAEKKEQSSQALADRQFRDAVRRQQAGLERGSYQESLRTESSGRELDRDTGQSDSYERRQAQTEVARQKRWLESQQREEQQAAQSRAARAQAERSRLEWEERRNAR